MPLGAAQHALALATVCSGARLARRCTQRPLIAHGGLRSCHVIHNSVLDAGSGRCSPGTPPSQYPCVPLPADVPLLLKL